jgi:DNA-directed RNA polymerase specialized sigma24 family protein
MTGKMTVMTPVTNVDEAELFGLMAMQHTDHATASAAWLELRERHWDYLFRCVRKAFGPVFHFNEQDLGDIVDDAFKHAFDWAGKHPTLAAARERFTSQLPDGARRRFRAWLGKAAQNISFDRLRKAPPSMSDIELLHEVLRAPDERFEPSIMTPLIECVARIMADLSPDDAEVVRASLSFYDLKTEKFKPESGEVEQIASALGMRADTFRKRRHRLLAYLRARLRAEGFPPPNSGDES